MPLRGETAIPAGRRAWFACALPLGILLASELAALALYRLATGEAFSYHALSSMRAARRAGAETAVMDLGGDEPDGKRDKKAPAIHPYMGYMLDNGALPPDEASRSEMANYGFAAGTLPLERSPDTLVVGVFGGSLAKRLMERGGAQDMEKLIEGGRAAAGRKVAVVNCAIGAFKQPQQLMALSYLLVLGAQLDVVVNVDGFNEVALTGTENLPAGVFPLYPRAWQLTARVPDPERVATLGELRLLSARRRAWAATFDGALRHSVVANLVWRRRDERMGRDIHACHSRLLTLRAAPRPAVTGPARPATSREELLEEIAAAWARSSLLMDAACRARGIAYLHVLQPNQYVPDSKEMGAEERARAYDPRHPYKSWVEQGYPHLRKEGWRLGRRGVAFRDLSLVYRGHAEPLYRDNCCHPNDEGNRILRQAVSEAVGEILAPAS